jgi:predicted nucleic acid-binding protein
MKELVLIDAGPLVALVNRKAAHHDWAVELVKRKTPPFLTCEAALAEASHLVSSIHGAAESLLEYVQRKLIQCPFRIDEEAESLRRLMAKYQDLPMSLADACLVRMSELNPTAKVATLDHHFTIYRRHGRQGIPTIMPADK